MEVLAAFVREQSGKQSEHPPDAAGQTASADVQAAMTVIGRRDARRDRQPIDLTGAILPHAKLDGANLADAALGHAVFAHATLIGTDLASADLAGANLVSATLLNTNFSGARLPGADLSNALLGGADFTGAWLVDANLTGASVHRTHLEHPDMYTGPADFTCAFLFMATWPENGPVPAGWVRGPDGTLRSARENTGDAGN